MGKKSNIKIFWPLGHLVCYLLLVSTSWADLFPADPSQLSISIKIHRIGPGGLVSNLGYMGKPVGFEIENLDNSLAKIAELAPTTGGRNSMYLGGIVNHQKVYTCGEEWSDLSNYWGYEFFPSGAPWDTIWVAYRSQELDIPYMPGYVGISDEDFICRFDDYHVNHPDQGASLGAEVILISHSWGVPGYNLWKYYQFYVIAKEKPIDDLFFAWSSFGRIGLQPTDPSDWVETGDDDISYFDDDLKVAWKEDQPGHDEDGFGPAGFKIWVPEAYDEHELTWSLNNTVMPNHNDEQWYDILASGVQDPPNYYGPMPEKTFMTLAVGPFDMEVGDTLHFRVADIMGQDQDDVLENLYRLEGLIEKGFALPTSPPPPPLKVQSGNHEALLTWEAGAGEVNPLMWVDTNRHDSDVEPQPFEGFRLYKSFNPNGPWTLLAEYDVPDNGINQDIGLEFEYRDVGLLNNFRYYYSVTSFTKPDRITNAPSLSSALQLNVVEVIPGTQVPESIGNVFVVPNPYRGDQNYTAYKPPWEEPSPLQNIINQQESSNVYRWSENDRRVQFVNVPSPAEIKIYSLAGDLVTTLYHDIPHEGVVDWNLTTDKGLTIASGIYLFTAEDSETGKTQVGRFVVIK